jgi:hypothetical protein
MISAKVVNRPNQIHPCFKRFALTRYCSPSAHKARQALPKRRVESFDEGRVDYSCPLCFLDHSFNFRFGSFNNPPINADNPSLIVLLYGLRDEDSLPHLQTRATSPTTHHRLTKHLSNRTDVSLQPIRAEQDTGAQGSRTGTHFLNQRSYKRSVTACRNNASQPKPCADHQGRSHPKNATLEFYSKLIHLHLAQITRRGDKLLVNRVAMAASPQLPTCDRALVKAKSSNDGLSRAAERQQSNHLSDKYLRMAKAVKGSAFGFGKSLATERTLVASFFERVKADVAFIEFTSGRAVHIRTKYLRRVQEGNPFRFSDQKPKRIIFGPSFSFKTNFSTFYCGATHRRAMRRKWIRGEIRVVKERVYVLIDPFLVRGLSNQYYRRYGLDALFFPFSQATDIESKLPAE